MTHVRQAFGDYTISEDPAGFDLPRAYRWISEESYWAKGIPLETFTRAAANSLVLTAQHPEAGMVGMARIVTDRATFAWICDVFIDSGHRGRGIGGKLMEAIRAHPDLQGLRRMHLATQDAHSLYARYGFGPMTFVDRWMQIHDPDVYKRGASTT